MTKRVKLNKNMKTFKQYLKENWSELVEHAENMTGESYTGREPLLSKDTIIELAKDLWTNERSIQREIIRKELSRVILPVEVPRDEFNRVINYLLTIGWFDRYIELGK